MDIKTKSVILILITFMLGIISGFFLHSIFIARQFPPMDHGGRMPFRLSERLDNILQLNPEQMQKINPIITRYDNEIHETVERNRTLGTSIMDSMRTEIAPFLSDKQKSLLDDEMNHFKNPPPPGHPQPMQ